MYTYNPWTGDLSRDGKHMAVGYSGAGAGRNNPNFEQVHSIGPTPRGAYALTLEPAGSHPRLTDPVFRLHPKPGNPEQRPGLLIHGDNATHTASEGCTILDHATRVAIASTLSEDSDWLVAGDRGPGAGEK